MIFLLQHILDRINESPTAGSILVSLQVYTTRSSGGKAPHILNIDFRNGCNVVFKIRSPYPQEQSLEDAQHVVLKHNLCPYRELHCNFRSVVIQFNNSATPIGYQ